MSAPRLIIALDLPDARAALSAAERFSGLPVWMKVGLELFTAAGPEVVRLSVGIEDVDDLLADVEQALEA